MKTLSVLVFASLIALGSQGQVKDVLGKAQPNAGSLLTQFASALKPGSFLPSWGGGGKADWLSTAGNVSDAAGMGKQTSSLAGFIKPEMFKQGISAAGISKAASTVKTYAEASGVLKNLESGLKPEAFLSSWAGSKSGWLSALNLLK